MVDRKVWCRSGPSSHSAYSEGEDDEALLGHLAHRVGRAFARVARSLDAPVGHLVGAESGRFVDHHAPELERPAGSESRLDVAREDARLEAELRPVGEVE